MTKNIAELMERGRGIFWETWNALQWVVGALCQDDSSSAAEVREHRIVAVIPLEKITEGETDFLEAKIKALAQRAVNYPAFLLYKLAVELSPEEYAARKAKILATDWTPTLSGRVIGGDRLFFMADLCEAA